MTAGERLMEAGRREAVKKTGAKMLLKLLQSRFGPVPDAAVARIQAADSAPLEAWFDRALSATTLDEVFAGA